MLTLLAIKQCRNAYLTLRYSKVNEGVMVRRKSFFNEIDEIIKRFEVLFDEQEEIYGLEGFGRSFSSRYSIIVTYDDHGKPIVRVSAQGDIDKSEMERYIKERYPNAKIVWEDGDVRSHVKPVEDNHVREVFDQEHSAFQRTKRPRESEIVELNSKKPRIYEVKMEGRSEGKSGREWYDIKVD